MSSEDHASPLDVPPPLPPDLGFHGDYYGQGGDDFGRDVTRGVTMGSNMDMPPPYFHNSGDFYTEEDDTVRGVSTGCLPGQPNLWSKAAPNQWGEYGMGYGGEPYGMLSYDSQGVQERFQPGDRPRKQPTSQFFNLEQTTVHLKTEEPDLIGNVLLDYLSTQVTNILKTRRQKFWIKAEVFSGSVLCTTKFKVWETPEQEFAVEFIRNSGDAFAFGDTYRGACAALANNFPSIRGLPQEPLRLEPPPPVPSEESDDADMAPLFDMAACDECPSLQAEAAVALAKIAASNDSKMAQLCKPYSLDHLSKLLKSDRLDIAYPTAQVLTSLVDQPAGQSIAEHSIFKEMVAKVSAPDTTSIVQEKVAQTVSVAARKFAATMSAAVAQDIQKSLEVTIQELKGDYDSPQRAATSLQDALLEINQYCPPVGGR
jgi:hypothetical protein